MRCNLALTRSLEKIMLKFIRPLANVDKRFLGGQSLLLDFAEASAQLKFPWICASSRRMELLQCSRWMRARWSALPAAASMPLLTGGRGILKLHQFLRFRRWCHNDQATSSDVVRSVMTRTSRVRAHRTHCVFRLGQKLLLFRNRFS